MIDIQKEQVVSLTKATHEVPKKPHVSTLFRWAQKGVRGIRLETIQIGGTRCTSLEALQRFFDQLTQAAGSNAPSLGSGPQVHAQVEATESQLDAAGI